MLEKDTKTRSMTTEVKFLSLPEPAVLAAHDDRGGRAVEQRDAAYDGPVHGRPIEAATT